MTLGRRLSGPADGVAACVDKDITNPDWVEIAEWLEQPTQHQLDFTRHRNPSKHIKHNWFFLHDHHHFARLRHQQLVDTLPSQAAIGVRIDMFQMTGFLVCAPMLQEQKIARHRYAAVPGSQLEV